MDLLWSHPVPGGISCFKYSDDGKFYYTVGGDGYLRKWNAPTGTQVEEKKIPIDTPFAAVDVSTDGNSVVFFKRSTVNNIVYFTYLWKTSEDTLRLLEAKNYKDYEGQSGRLYRIYNVNIAFLKGNKTVFINCGIDIAYFTLPSRDQIYSQCQIWNIETLSKVASFNFGLFNSIALSNDKQLFTNNSLLVKDTSHINLNLGEKLYGFCFDINSKNIYYSANRGDIYRYNFASKSVPDTIRTNINYYENSPYVIRDLKISNNSRFIVYSHSLPTESELNCLKIINSKSGKLLDTLVLPFSGTSKIELCPDSLNFITYSSDSIIRCWSSEYFNNSVLFAEFSSNIKEETPPVKIQFNDASLGKIQSWLWDFGDGSTSTEVNPTHFYDKKGWYSVSLTIRDSLKQATIVKDSMIHIRDIEFLNGSDFDTLCTFRIKNGDFKTLKFIDDDKKLIAFPETQTITTLDISKKIVEKELILKEHYDALGLSNDNKKIVGFRTKPDGNSNNNIYNLFDIQNENIIFRDTIYSPVDAHYIAQIVNLQHSDLFMLPGDSTFICNSQYYLYCNIHGTHGSQSYYLNTIFASAVTFDLNKKSRLFPTFIWDSIYYNAIYSPKLKKFAISYLSYHYKQNKSHSVRVIGGDTTQLLNRVFPNDYPLLLAFTNKSNHLIYSDNKYAISTISLTDTNSISLISKNSTKPTAITVTNDDKYVVVGYDDGFVKLLEISSGTFVDSVKAPYSIANLALSQNNEMLAIALKNGKVYILKNSKYLQELFDTPIPSISTVSTSYPNPSSDYAKVNFTLEEPNNLIIKVFNSSGQEIKTLVNKFQEKGKYEIKYDAQSLPVGIYFFQIQIGSNVNTVKFIKQSSE
jgi:PKD repeat protein